MQWTDKIRQYKIIFICVAIFIVTASLIISHILVKDLANEERKNMGIWAEAMRSFNSADENTDLNLVLKIINSNNTIPIVVLTQQKDVYTFRNININEKNYNDSIKQINLKGKKLFESGRFIRIDIKENNKKSYLYVCYDDSIMIKRLSIWPYIQLCVVILFVIIAIISLLIFKKSEQNKLWVGLSKETAHQLGTPISSLMAWVEILKENYPQDELIPEMNNDVTRLKLIAERFSKIGSIPEPRKENLNNAVNRSFLYIKKRTSSHTIVNFIPSENDIFVLINTSLFEWVIENICKNAADAITSKGNIELKVTETKTKAIIEISDNGKGIKKKDLKNIFKPGFTTKKRGWGLGLSLAKRIIEEYHNGRIFVAYSEVGVGTKFRIELKKIIE